MSSTVSDTKQSALISNLLKTSDFFLGRVRDLRREHQDWVTPGTMVSRLLGQLNELETTVAELRRQEDHRRSNTQRGLNIRTQNIMVSAFTDALKDVEQRSAVAPVALRFPTTTFSGTVYSPAEVLQFLALNKKTGEARMRLPGEVVKIALVAGDVVSAASSNTPPALRLGELLVAQGSIDDKALNAFLDAHHGERIKLGKALEEEKLVSSDDVYKALRRQASALFARCLKAENVDVEFTPLEIARQDFSADLVSMLLEGTVEADSDSRKDQ